MCRLDLNAGPRRSDSIILFRGKVKRHIFDETFKQRKIYSLYLQGSRIWLSQYWNPSFLITLDTGADCPSQISQTPAQKWFHYLCSFMVRYKHKHIANVYTYREKTKEEREREKWQRHTGRLESHGITSLIPIDIVYFLHTVHLRLIFKNK